MSVLQRLTYLAALSLCIFATSARGQMTHEQTLDHLRAGGQFEHALTYLASVAENLDTPDEFKKALFCYQGAILVQLAQTQKDLDERERTLDSAKQALERFTTENTTSRYVPAARNQLTRVLIERARLNTARSKDTGRSAHDSERLLVAARKMYDRAYEVAAETRESLKTRLDALPLLVPGDHRHEKLLAAREQYRRAYLDARFLSPLIKEDKANAYPSDSDEWRTLLIAAAEDFAAAHIDYRHRPEGARARMLQGRCYQKLGDHQQARRMFQEVIDLPLADEQLVQQARELAKRPMGFACGAREIDVTLTALLHASATTQEKLVMGNSLRSLICAVAVWTITGASAAPANEALQERLEKLRGEKQYDEAIELLRAAKDSPDASGDFKRKIDYEIGRTLVEASRIDRETMRREARLEEAAASLRKFVKEHPDHALVSSARGQLGNLFVEHARIMLTRSARNGIEATTTNLLQKEARTLLALATATLETSRKDIRERLEKLGPVRGPEVNQLRADYLQLRLLLPSIQEETADTFSDEAGERNEHLAKAAEQFQEVYRDYRTRVAGLYARMYEGRCYVKLGEHKKALGVFQDLLEQPDEPAVFRQLKLKVVTLAVDAWLDDSQKKYEDAIRQMKGMLEGAAEDEKTEEDWLFVQFSLARACKMLASDLSKTKPDDPQVAELLAASAKHAAFVAKHPGNMQLAARELLAGLGKPVEPPTAKNVKSFDEARLSGRRAIDEWSKAKVAIIKLEAQIGATDDRAEIEKLEEQLFIQTVAGSNALKQSEQYFQRALELAGDDESEEQVATVRYIICYVHYEKEEYAQAAELGEELAREHTTTSAAAQSAKIAFASYMKLYQKSDTDKQREAAVKSMLDFGDYILEQWPENPIFDEVKNSLDIIKKREAQRKAGALDA